MAVRSSSSFNRAPRLRRKVENPLWEWRKSVGADLLYLNANLPVLERLPAVETILGGHKDLTEAEQIRQSISSGKLPALREDSADIAAQLRDLRDKLKALVEEEQRVSGAPYGWTNELIACLRVSGGDERLSALERLRPAQDRLPSGAAPQWRG